MDISATNQQLLTQLKPLLKAQGAKAIEAALAPGKQLSATVERVTEVTPELRGRLLQLFAESKAAQANPKSPANPNVPNQGNLASNLTSPTTPTANNSASALMNAAKNSLGSSASLVNSLPQLLNAKLLNLLEVKVLNTKLLMLSQLSIPTKTVVQFQVRPDGQLELIPKPNSQNTPNPNIEKPSSLTTTNTNQVQPQNTKNQAQLYQAQSKSLLNQKVSSNTLNTTASNTNINQTKTQELHSALKTYLPLQQNLAKALNQLQQVVVASDTTKLEQSLPKLAPVFTELKSLLDKIPSAEQLNHSQKVKANIERSGFFLESSLKKLTSDLQNNAANKPTPTTTGTSTNTANTSTVTPKNVADKPAPIEDLKTSLLKLMDDLQQLLPKAPHQTSAQNKSQSVDSLIRSIFSFTQSGKTQTTENNPQQLSQNIARNLHTTVFSAIARISLLQIQQLLQQESGQLSQGFNIELPIKFGEQLLPLSLSVHERWYDDNEKDKDEKKKKEKKHEAKKRWHVFMEFDLDEYGSFASDITLQEGSVKSTLWVQKKQLWQTTQAHLGELRIELEKNGIDVEEITLHQGKAPEKPLEVSQSLVDIRT